MENFNKENLFNELQEHFPKGMKVFLDWVEEYKSKNRWKRLFGRSPYKNWEKDNGSEFEVRQPDFYDIPLAFQKGIWIEFVCSRGGCQWEIDDLFSHDFREEICKYIQMIHEDELILES